MKQVLVRAACGVVTSFALVSRGAEFKFPNQTLTLPDGFEVELVAGTNLVDRPVSMDFDELGRLYVTISSGSNDKVQKQLEDKPHRVVRLEDTDGDGRFDKSSLYADKLMFPEGAMWLDGSLYVSAPPSIWKLTDTDGDGVADKREEWHEGKTLTGCANDLHGPQLGPDGWVYWCKGAFAEQTYEVNGKPFVTRASHIFRARPDHSGIEPVLTGGMDNPVAIEFTAGGERLLTGTFFEPGGGKRDGVIHAVYGGVYGKQNAVLDGHARTGDLMPVTVHLGPSASCSINRYRSTIFGSEYRNNIFVCNFNLHNVTRHVLQPDGASFKPEDSPFISSENPDFHPTCILEDADGSLLMIDTGGWYKICCPTSQLYKPDVLGAIYRIRRKGAPKMQDPRGLKIRWEKSSANDLAKLLGDERLYVRKRAVREIAAKGNKAVSALKQVLKKSDKSASAAETRCNAIWALTQIDSTDARTAVRAALNDKDEVVRSVALHSVSLWRDTNALPQLLNIVTSDAPQLKRVAAEALGRVGNKSAVPSLLQAAAGVKDRFLQHSITYALMEIGDAQQIAAGLNSKDAGTKQMAMIALDQLNDSRLKPELVAPLFASSDPMLKQTAAWLLAHHPEWAQALTGVFSERLKQGNLTAEASAELQSQLAQFADDAAVQKLIADTLRGTDKKSQLLVLRAIAESGIKEAPEAWSSSMIPLLSNADAELVQQTILTGRSVSPAKASAEEFTKAVAAVAGNKQLSDDIRVNALASLPANRPLDEEFLKFALANIIPSKPVATRGAAVAVLTKAKLTDEQLAQVIESLRGVGPMELTKLLAIFEKSTSEVVGAKLVSVIRESKAFSSLRVDTLKPVFAKYPPAVQQQAETLYASLNVDASKQAKHVDELLAGLKNGDIRRGQAVFNSAKAACSSCHSIGYGGGHVGPDLTKIGQVRTERDLLEAIVYPSASFVRSYEPLIVLTESGDDYSGVLKKDGLDEIILETGPNAQIKIARKDITEMRPGTVSVMPAGLNEQLTQQELADLIAFLKATRW